MRAVLAFAALALMAHAQKPPIFPANNVPGTCDGTVVDDPYGVTI